MRKQLLLLCSLALSTLLSAQTATWNGSASDSWNDAANWTWSNGTTGVPNATTDVSIDGAAQNNLILLPFDSVCCKNLYLEGSIVMSEFSILNIFGTSVTANSSSSVAGIDGSDPTSGQLSQHAKIIFSGNNSKTIDGAVIVIGKLDINCNNVTLVNQAQIIAHKQLKFSKPSVSLGNASAGNLTISPDAGVYLSPLTEMILPSHTQNQIPPHIIATSPISMNNTNYGGMIIIFDAVNESGLNGHIKIPSGPSDKAYTPVDITHTGYNPWCVTVHKNLPTSCSNNSVVNNTAVQYIYDIFPIDMSTGELSSNLSTPASISCTFNKQNIGEDVLNTFNPGNQTLKLYQIGASGCYTLINSAAQTSPAIDNYVTIGNTTQGDFGNFILAPSGTSSLNDLQLSNLKAYPNPVLQTLNLSLSATHEAFQANLTNVLGQVVWTGSYAANSLRQEQSINLQALPAGTYLLQLRSDKNHLQQTIIKK